MYFDNNKMHRDKTKNRGYQQPDIRRLIILWVYASILDVYLVVSISQSFQIIRIDETPFTQKKSLFLYYRSPECCWFPKNAGKWPYVM